MASNRGTEKYVFIAFGTIFLIAVIIAFIFFFTRTHCPKEVDFEIGPSEEVTTRDLVTLTDKSLKVKSWDWDFGDNSPHEHFKQVTHKYHTPNTYTITLIVNGKCNAKQKKI